MGSSQQFSLRWNNYLKYITDAFDTLRTHEDLVDVTLSCEGKRIRAHKMLLSACSTYLRDLFKENPCQHPVIIFRNVKFDDLAALVKFMYQGEVNVVQEQLASFLTTAELLEVKGLTQDTAQTNDMVIEDDVEIPNEPEVQLQNLSGTISINNKDGSSPSSPLQYHSVDIRSDTPPNKKRKFRENSSSSSEKNSTSKDVETKSTDSQKTGSDPVEIIPLMPNLKLEMPEYLEQDGSSCSYEEQNVGESSSRLKVDGSNSETTEQDQKPDISQTFYASSQASSDTLDPSKPITDLGHMLSKPSTSGERTQEAAQDHYTRDPCNPPDYIVPNFDYVFANNFPPSNMQHNYPSHYQNNPYVTQPYINNNHAINNNSSVSASGGNIGPVHNPLPFSQRNQSAEDLKNYLEKNVDGKIVLNYYQKHNSLTSRLRTSLVHTIIGREKDILTNGGNIQDQLDKFKISTDKFKSLAEDIVEVFPTEEQEIYYTPYRKIDDMKIPPSGKLWDHFNYVKARLRKDFNRAKPETEKEIPRLEITESDTLKLHWLQQNVEPWVTCTQYWNDTFYIRRQELFLENTSVSDYFSKFRCLRQGNGYDLLKYDFDRLFPGKGPALFIRWETVKPKLITLLEASNEPVELDKKNLILQLRNLKRESQDAVILYLLPILIKPSQIRPSIKDRKTVTLPENETIKNKRNKKPSVAECQESIMLHVQVAADIESTVQSKQNELQLKGQTLQPVIIVVGPLTNVEEVYVQVGSVRYKVTSVLRAIDLAFKTFYAVDCEYPEFGHQIWLFFQQFVYGINNPADRVGSALKQLMVEIARQ